MIDLENYKRSIDWLDRVGRIGQDFRDARNKTVHTYREEKAKEVAVGGLRSSWWKPSSCSINCRGERPIMAERGADRPRTEQDFAIVRGILEKYVPDRPVFVFGSRAIGKAKRRSDSRFGHRRQIGRCPMRLQGDLAEAFDESDLPIEVDVVTCKRHFS